MAGKGRVRKMFPGGNTVKGPYFLFEDMIKPAVNRVLIIKGGPGTGKSTMMNAISRELTGRGYNAEHYHCSTDPDSLDGIVIPELGVAILDGTPPHPFEPVLPGVRDEIVDLGEYWDTSAITPHKEEIERINKRGNMLFKTAFSLLKQSKLAYDQWQWYVEESMDRTAYNRLAKRLSEKVFEGYKTDYRAASYARHLFASALTPKGIIDFKDSLVERNMYIYSIKGQPGTGVKELIMRIASDAEEMGLYTEQYHCPFEPEKLDMLIIPELGKAVMNTNPPEHRDPAIWPEAGMIEEIDLNRCIKRFCLDDYEEERRDAESRFRQLLNKGLEYISRARAEHGKKEKFYGKAMNYDLVEAKKEEILNRILESSQ
ncbi:MAG: hypothetical protein GX854_05310 [Clostridiales bacterium]|nr:hypothetical protein [Clostridiales bacterium]